MKTKYIWVAGMMLALLAACDDSKYNLENLVPDEYHTVLYLKESGTVDMAVYDLGIGYQTTYEMLICQGGSEPSLTASADFVVRTEEEVNELYYDPIEDIPYRVIPSDLYSFDMTHVDFASEDRYKYVTLTFDDDAMVDLLESDTTAYWVLSVVLTSESDSVNADKCELLFDFEIVAGKIGFVVTDTLLTYTYNFATTQMQIPFGLNASANAFNIECTFEVDEDYLDTYNRNNATSYPLLPEDYYSFDLTQTIPEGSTSINLPITLTSGLPMGDYLLPLRLVETELFEMDENVLCAIVVRVMGVQYDRSDWTVAFYTSQASTAYIPQYVFDGDMTTVWHTRNNSGSSPWPHHLVIDLQTAHNITQVGMYQRVDSENFDIKTGNFYVLETSADMDFSSYTAQVDLTDWTQVGSFDIPYYRTYVEEVFHLSNPVSGRYILLEFTANGRSSETYVTAFAELFLYGTE